MPKPVRTFEGIPGAPSTGIGGPDQIEKDFDTLFVMLDPAKTTPDGDDGGIGMRTARPI